MTGSGKSFGACCETLKEAMAGAEFEPLIAVGEDDGVLYLTVGWIDVDDEQPGAVQFPMLHCPFCGTSLQTVEEIDAKGAGFSS